MPSSRPFARIEDILENARAALDYTRGMTQADYLADRKTQDACERCLSRLSEAAVKLGAFAEERLPHHKWSGIRGIGNILRHDYDRVETVNIWDVITRDLPALVADIEALLRSVPDTER